MRIEQSAPVAAPPDKVWALLQDLELVAPCVPGVGSVRRIDDGRCAGVMQVAVGPIRLALAGEVSVVERRPEERSLVMRVNAADPKVGGSVRADVRLTVIPEASPDASRLNVVTETQVMGRIAEFGQSIIKRKADQIMAEFAARLARAVAEPA